MLDRQANVKIGQKEQADSMVEMRDRTCNSLYYYYLFFCFRNKRHREQMKRTELDRKEGDEVKDRSCKRK